VKVFLDTNVLASAFGTHGLCRQLMRRTLEKHELLTSETVIIELTRVLIAKFKLPRAEVDLAVAVLRTATVLPEPAPENTPSLPDPDDEPIVATALEGHADLFITGDRALLELREVEGLPVLSPRDAWGQVTAGE